MILVSKPSKPIKYTLKENPKRQETLRLYEEEIEKAYEAVQESSQQDILSPTKWDISSTRIFLEIIIHRVLSEKIREDEDFFAHGCDRCVIYLGYICVGAQLNSMQSAGYMDKEFCSPRSEKGSSCCLT